MPAPRTEGGENRASQLYDRFAEAAAEQCRTVAQFETWESHEELRRKTDADFEAELKMASSSSANRAVQAWRSWQRASVVDSLPHLPGRVDQLVPWAPPAALDESEERPSIIGDVLSDVEFPVQSV